MPDINTYLQQIESATYGRDVRSAIHDGIELCYSDVETAQDAAAASATAAAGSLTNLAPAFSDSTAYAVGDYVIYNGVLYKFITAHAAGAWTGSDAETATFAGETGAIKSAIDDITETVQSSNIFDQASETVTEGKYLNPSTGNEGTNASFCYTNEYIPVEPNTTYIGTVWQKSNLVLLGYYVELTCFYDENKQYVSGVTVPTADNGVFTIPNNVHYIRFSVSINSWNNRYYMIEKGSAASSSYIPYSSTSILKLPLVVVDANGNGRFTSIADAVNAAESGSTIIVMPGTYEETLTAWGKNIHLIGASREACIIKNASGDYSTPPIEIGAGSVQNLTIIEDADGAGSENSGAYAIHVEDNNLYEKNLLIRNCYISSDSSSAIGIGLRGGCNVRIEDCEIVCEGARVSAGAAPVYFHDADASAYWGTANLYLKNNVLRNNSSSLYSMLTINSIHAENTTYLHFMYNILVRSSTPALTQKFNTWNTSGNTSADGWNGLSKMYLTDDSFGNNLTEMNYGS